MCGITSARYRTKVSMRSDIGVDYLCPIPLNAYIFKNLNLSLKSSLPVNGKLCFDCFFLGRFAM